MKFQTNFKDLSVEEQQEKLQRLNHDFIRIKTGDALVNSQYVEFLLKGLCEQFKPLGLQIDINDLMSNNHSKQTLGQLKNVLKEADLLDNKFIERLEKYIKNRNIFVHGLYFYTFQKEKNSERVGSAQSEKYVTFCNNLTEEGTYIIETVMGMYVAFAQSYSNKTPELTKIIDELNTHLPDALKALRKDFENRMKQKGCLPS